MPEPPFDPRYPIHLCPNGRATVIRKTDEEISWYASHIIRTGNLSDEDKLRVALELLLSIEDTHPMHNHHETDARASIQRALEQRQREREEDVQ